MQAFMYLTCTTSSHCHTQVLRHHQRSKQSSLALVPGIDLVNHDTQPSVTTPSIYLTSASLHHCSLVTFTVYKHDLCLLFPWLDNETQELLSLQLDWHSLVTLLCSQRYLRTLVSTHSVIIILPHSSMPSSDTCPYL